MNPERTPSIGPILTAGMLLGCGMGGFFDGIVFHQILQWHNMLSSVTPPTTLVAMKYNMLWDGAFHGATWLMTAAGLTRLWLAGHRGEAVWSSQAFAGALLLGWGLFNTLEGLLDHQLLGIHHVHPGKDELAWDLGFLISGVVMLATGLVLIRGVRSS